MARVGDGTLITLEGIDGSGKSSCWRALQDTAIEATYTREPTDSWYGEAVGRSIETEGADPLAECFLYLADHAAHLSNTIEPALDAGGVVISDRYIDSRIAYQGVTLTDRFEDPMAFVRSCHEPWSRWPDHTIYLDVPPAVGAERAGETNKFERTETLTRVSETYERLLETDPDRFHRIDADRPIEAVKADVIERVTQVLSA